MHTHSFFFGGHGNFETMQLTHMLLSISSEVDNRMSSYKFQKTNIGTVTKVVDSVNDIIFNSLIHHFGRNESVRDNAYLLKYNIIENTGFIRIYPAPELQIAYSQLGVEYHAYLINVG